MDFKRQLTTTFNQPKIIGSLIKVMNIINSNYMIPKSEPKICKTYIVGGNAGYKGKTIAMTIPMEFRKFYDLEKPTNVLITPTEDGLLVKKLEIKQ